MVSLDMGLKSMESSFDMIDPYDIDSLGVDEKSINEKIALN
jgi:hypothetical protein